MSNNSGPILDRVVIILIAIGVVILGAKDLAHLRSDLAMKNPRLDMSGTRSVLTELRADPSTSFSDGVPVEKLTAKTDSEVRARYPFTFHKENDRFSIRAEDRASDENLSLTARLKRLFGK
ncbi:hypothetical protein EBR25_02840 [bacterium]|nr:hypothetical protein [bacterium]